MIEKLKRLFQTNSVMFGFYLKKLYWGFVHMVSYFAFYKVIQFLRELSCFWGNSKRLKQHHLGLDFQEVEHNLFMEQINT